MTGQELYEMCCEEYKTLGAIAYTWEELDEDDQLMWAALADKLRRTGAHGGDHKTGLVGDPQ